jgi:hypothetical protein
LDEGRDTSYPHEDAFENILPLPAGPQKAGIDDAGMTITTKGEKLTGCFLGERAHRTIIASGYINFSA